MAIELKSPQGYWDEVAMTFGVPSSLITKAKNAGVVLESTTPGVVKVVKGAFTFSKITIKPSAITLAANGKLGPASKSAIRFAIEKGLTEAIESVTGDVVKAFKSVADAGIDPPEDISSFFGKPSESLTESVSQEDTLLPAISPSVKKGKAVVVKTLISPANPTSVATLGKEADMDPAIFSKPPVSLSLADTLYQPVYGTSSGSVYFVAAFFKGGALAVRLTHQGKFSIRLQGSGVMSYLDHLSSVGITKKESYLSCHYDIPLGADDPLVLKTFGAVLGVLGLHNLISVADIQWLLKESVK